MELRLESELDKDYEGRIKYRIYPGGSREHYHLIVHLQGSHNILKKIRKVIYKLHPTFRRQYRSSSNLKYKFAISIWTWGMFVIKARILFKDGSEEIIKYYLSYKLPPDNGTNYVQVDI